MMTTKTLNGADWTFRDCSAAEWYPATVPGTLFLDMMRCGLLKDPYYRFNERKMNELAQQDYEYQLRFTVPEDLLRREHLRLVFEGIDTISRIELNGALLAETDNMHRTYRFDVKERLTSGENTLLVRLFSPVKYIAERHAEAPLPEFNTASPHGFTQIRKIHSAFGWDAEPVVPDSGLWRDVYLEAFGPARIEHVYIRQRHAPGRVDLRVETHLETRRYDGYTLKVLLEGPAGETVAQAEAEVRDADGVTDFVVENPALWWPNGYGEQPLYRVTVRLYKDGGQLDAYTHRVGLRELAVRREPDEAGESFGFVVNGVPVFAKGGNYTPPDKFLTLCRGERHRRLIHDCVEANYNCIRIWGGAVYPDDELFDLCDEQGLLVWQDFMFACGLYHVNDAFVENIRQELRDNIYRLRNHPSLALWCGSNENEWFHDFEHEAEGLTYELRMDNLRQHEVIVRDVATACDSDRLYWPSSPSSGGGYNDPNGYAKGDVHCWYVWYLPAKPYRFYRECTGRFISEFGLESFQAVKTLSHYMEPEDMGPNTEVMDYMQHCSDNFCNMGNGKIMNYIFQEVKAPRDFEEYVFASQYAQAEGIKYGVSHWRRLMPHCMGALYWQIVDCFPGTTWSSLDYEYRWKILHDYAKRFFSQVLVSAEDNGDSTRLFVVNDHPRGVSGTLDWALRDHAGGTIRRGRLPVTAPPSSSTCFAELDFSGDLDYESRVKTYLEFSFVDEGGTVLSADTLLFVKPKHFRFLQPDIRWSLRETERDFRVAMETTAYTKCIKLELREDDCHFSDNSFDLSPGAKKEIILPKDSCSRPLTLPEVQAQLCVRSLNTIG